MTCFMNCTPGPGSDETFYVLNMQEITIYGHTVDAWTGATYPEDLQHTIDGRKNGYEFGCWHSVACPDGELGSQHMTGLVAISQEIFELAREQSWPELLDLPITREGPVAAVYGVKDGKMVKVWDSLEGDAE